MSVRSTAIVLAAGQGRRMQTKVRKQYLMIGDHPVLYYSLKAFEESMVDDIILVTGPNDVSYCEKEYVEKYGFSKVRKVIPGGKERYHSVYEGLKAAEGTDYVLIHDGARPFLTGEIIQRTLDAAVQYGACVAGMPVKDTIKIADAEGNVSHTPNRSSVWTVQTPQTFSYQLIREAYQKLIERENAGEQIYVTDDAMVLEQILGRKVRLVEGSYENIKITTSSDLKIAEIFLKNSIDTL